MLQIENMQKNLRKMNTVLLFLPHPNNTVTVVILNPLFRRLSNFRYFFK